MGPAKKIVVCVLCFAMSPLALLAQATGAMLYSAGQVSVNGRTVTQSTAILPGDTIQVGANSSASISAQLLSAQVSGPATLSWQPQALEFQSGSLTVSARAPWQIHVGASTVSLGAEMSKVEIIQREDVALIKLDEGSATLTEAGQSTPLKAGFTVARPHPVVAARPPAPASGPPEGKHSSHAAIIAVAVGGGAAAAIGVALGAKGSKQQTPVSPSVP